MFLVPFRVGQQPLELAVLGLLFLKPPFVRDIHPAVLVPPDVEARLGELVPAAQLLHRHTALGFLQKPNDLLFRIGLLHVQPPGQGQTLDLAATQKRGALLMVKKS